MRIRHADASIRRAGMAQEVRASLARIITPDSDICMHLSLTANNSIKVSETVL